MVIILFIFYKILDLYFKKPPIDKENQRILSEQGINIATQPDQVTNISSYKTTIDNARNKVKEFNLRIENQDKEMESYR